MKKIFILGLICCMLGILSGCGSKEDGSTDKKEPSVEELSNRLFSELTYEDSLSMLNNEVALKYYGIDPEIVKSSAIYISTGATAEEIAVFEAVSNGDADTIYEACVKRKDTQIESYSDYKPSETSRLDHHVLKKSGRFVVFCVNYDDNEVNRIIDDVLD